MPLLPTAILSLEVQMPSRWALDEARLVRVRLRNRSDVDISQVRLQACWSDTVDAEASWRMVGSLHRQACSHALELRLTPSQKGEDALQFHLEARAAGFLEMEMWSEKLPMFARARPIGNGGINVDLRGAGIQGDRMGFGQVSADGGGGIGHHVHVHGDISGRNVDQWMEGDPEVGRTRELTVSVAREKCLPWRTQTGLALQGIVSGEFVMGASPGDREARPDETRRLVTLSHPFWIAQHPVTNADYERVMGVPTPVRLESHRDGEMPVACVTWQQAVDFCERLTRLEQSMGGLPPEYAYRLPTEAEWEYACRAGTSSPRYGPLRQVGSVVLNSGGLGNVGRFNPNPWGLYDMLGLVFEWCADVYAPYRILETTDPCRTRPEPGDLLQRVVRGGCYQGPDSFARASARCGRDPVEASHRIGFRVVLGRQRGAQ